jgi:protein-tyrosine phosphatase
LLLALSDLPKSFTTSTPLVDLHCHIVPGVDDGAPDVDTALAMIRQAKSVGVTAILTTPHILAHPAERATHDEHKRAFATLLEAHANSDVADVELRLSGEVRVTGDTMRIIDDATFTYAEEGKYILLELPSQEVPHYFSQTLFEFRLRGICPIVAHPERNMAVLKRPQYAVEFVRQGAHLQLTTSSLNGELGPTIEAASVAMLQAGIVSFVASDSHNLTMRSFLSWERTREAFDNHLDSEGKYTFSRLASSNPAAVLNGVPLDLVDIDGTREDAFLDSFSTQVGLKPEKRKRFFFF